MTILRRFTYFRRSVQIFEVSGGWFEPAVGFGDSEGADMWLINDDGFFSTVQDWEDDGCVYVRGRSETDLEAFVEVASQAVGDGAGWEPELVHTPHRDYAWRVHAPREIWVGYLAAKATELSYSNFKSHCADRWFADGRDSTNERLEILHDAWLLMNHWPDSQLI